jgi:hypothetical protein
MIWAGSMCLLIGCSPTLEPIDPPYTESRFCDTMTERFRYRQEEIDLRTEAGFTANLAREYRLNLSWDRECAPQ